MSLLELHTVRKSYRTHASPALDGVTLRVEAGEVVGLLGTSGSGKTTLLNLSAGLDRPDSGEIFLMGQPLSRLSQSKLTALRRQHLGFVFQTLNLLPTLTAAENVELPLALSGWAAGRRRERVGWLLDKAGLCSRGGDWPDELSIGQQQRLAVLRAIAHEPAMVLMDEPTSAMDTENARALMELVLDLRQAHRAAILIATHDVRVASLLPRTIHMLDGKILPEKSA